MPIVIKQVGIVYHELDNCLFSRTWSQVTIDIIGPDAPI